MGYSKQVIKGASWLGLFRGVTRGISFLRTALLARLLLPSQFGFFAVASLVLALAELITETGINIVLVQKKEDINRYIDTAWITSILRGFIIGIFIFASAPLIAFFFKMPEVVPLLIIVSMVPIIRGFINPSKVKLIKDLRFRDEFFYNTAMFAVESVVTLLFAYYTHSAVSLVYGLLAGAIFDMVASFIIFKPIPHFAFKKALFKEIVSHGKWLTATGIFTYLYQNIDNIVIGRVLGPAALGLYDVSYKISSLPLTEISDVVGRATFPVMVKINDDIKRVRRAYFLSILFISLAAFFIGSILFFFPREIILIVLGPEWISAVFVLQILSIVGVLRAILGSVSYPLYSLGKQKITTYITFINLLLLGILIIPLVLQFNLIGAAFAVLISTAVTIPIAFLFVVKVFRLPNTSHE